jgi:hypothetical protein
MALGHPKTGDHPWRTRGSGCWPGGWALVPAASGPLGGGMVKLGHGSTTAALAVALAPYALWALLLSVFVVGYLAALARCIWRTGDQEAMERMIMVSACAVASAAPEQLVAGADHEVGRDGAGPCPNQPRGQPETADGSRSGQQASIAPNPREQYSKVIAHAHCVISPRDGRAQNYAVVPRACTAGPLVRPPFDDRPGSTPAHPSPRAGGAPAPWLPLARGDRFLACLLPWAGVF